MTSSLKGLYKRLVVAFYSFKLKRPLERNYEKRYLSIAPSAGALQQNGAKFNTVREAGKIKSSSKTAQFAKKKGSQKYSTMSSGEKMTRFYARLHFPNMLNWRK